AAHLKIPRSVLTARLSSLIEAGVLVRADDHAKRSEYLLTPKGLALWPIVLSLINWGDEFYAEKGPRRVFRHQTDGGQLDARSTCTACGQLVEAADVVTAPGPGLEPATKDSDLVTTALAQPRRLLSAI